MTKTNIVRARRLTDNIDSHFGWLAIYLFDTSLMPRLSIATYSSYAKLVGAHSGIYFCKNLISLLSSVPIDSLHESLKIYRFLLEVGAHIRASGLRLVRAPLDLAQSVL